MSFYRRTLLDALPLTGSAQYSQLIDCTRVISGSIQIVTGTTVSTPTYVVLVQGSNDVPPNGTYPGQPATNVFADPWAPTDWETVNDLAGSPISVSISATGVKSLQLPPGVLNFRFIRVSVGDQSAGAGGFTTVSAFLRGNPQ